MVHMPGLETREWGLRIFDSAPTLTTLYMDRVSSMQYKKKHRAQTLHCHTIHLQRADNGYAEFVYSIQSMFTENMSSFENGQLYEDVFNFVGYLSSFDTLIVHCEPT